MIGITDLTFRARAPWSGAGEGAGPGKSQASWRICRYCGAKFRPPSGEYAYRDGDAWFCRYQHLADWRKAGGKGRRRALGPQHEAVCGEVSAFGWRATEQGCRTRLRYCRIELAKREQTLENAKARRDMRLWASAKANVRAWRERLREAENMLILFESEAKKT